MITRLLAIVAAGSLSYTVYASDDLGDIVSSASETDIILADEKRRDRRDDRQDDRQDDRDDKQDCRQEEGRVGKDKRECKQDDRGEEAEVEQG